MADKKKGSKPQNPADDLKGFEEFIEGETDHSFMGKPPPRKNDPSFEHFTFLTNDGIRLKNINRLLNEKLSFIGKYPQQTEILKRQYQEVQLMSNRLVDQLTHVNSPLNLSLTEIFDTFFSKSKKED